MTPRTNHAEFLKKLALAKTPSVKPTNKGPLYMALIRAKLNGAAKPK